MIVVTLPIPPSANNLFFNLKTGGRAKTPEYNAWLKLAKGAMEAAWYVAGSPKIPDKQKMRLKARVGATYRRDVTNCIKPIEDALCAFLPVPDDRYNDHVEIVRDQTIEGFVCVELSQIGTPAVGDNAENGPANLSQEAQTAVSGLPPEQPEAA